MKNKNNKRTKAEVVKRLSKMDKKLVQAEKDLEYLQRFMKRYEKIEKNREALESYYYDQWMDDVNLVHTSDEYIDCKCCNQDSIWNVSQNLYMMRLKLIKRVVKGL